MATLAVLKALRIGLSRSLAAAMLMPWDVALNTTVGTITTMRSADIVKLLEADGWMLRSVRGSHHVFRHPVKPGHVSVPHPKKDLGAGLVHQLLKQAGLK